jgi:hypothetical protein
MKLCNSGAGCEAFGIWRMKFSEIQTIFTGLNYMLLWAWMKLTRKAVTETR